MTNTATDPTVQAGVQLAQKYWGTLNPTNQERVRTIIRAFPTDKPLQEFKQHETLAAFTGAPISFVSMILLAMKDEPILRITVVKLYEKVSGKKLNSSLINRVATIIGKNLEASQEPKQPKEVPVKTQPFKMKTLASKSKVFEIKIKPSEMIAKPVEQQRKVPPPPPSVVAPKAKAAPPPPSVAPKATERTLLPEQALDLALRMFLTEGYKVSAEKRPGGYALTVPGTTLTIQ